MNILGIESSCDETAAAVYGDDGLLSNIIASQVIHEQFGGVVPELASRAHHKKINDSVDEAIKESGVSVKDIHGIAVTQGPGLMGSLLVGLSFAKGLSISRHIPLLGINHIDAHMYAAFIEQEPVFPFLALVVSGGHTQIVKTDYFGNHEILGKTRDDAAGEAFDKIGKILGLPYPAGPLMDQKSRLGDSESYDFPQAMRNKGLDFSFSGLKTSVLYHLNQFDEEQKRGYLKHNINNLCASITRAITEVLVVKLERAVDQTGIDNIIVAGGVAANSTLREKVSDMTQRKSVNLHIPDFTYCTDNAAMIAVTGYLRFLYQPGNFDDLSIRPFARNKLPA